MVLGEVITEIGQIGLWLQALGIVIVLAIVFQIISFIYNRKRMREIYQIKKDMVRIERKLDKIIKQTK
jgi:biopolymer transport protein ExbB/TolQ